MASSSPVSLIAAATVFAVRDVARSVEHYRDVLGFRIEFTYGEPTFYAGVERGGVLIHLQAGGGTKRQEGQGSVYVFVDNVDALYEELSGRGARIVKPPQNYDYGMRGNYLAFGMESKASTAS